jgi:murein endopeptidase
MKRNGSRSNGHGAPTLAELIATVSKMTDNERLGALIVADMINTGKVRLGGSFRGRRVIVA